MKNTAVSIISKGWLIIVIFFFVCGCKQNPAAQKKTLTSFQNANKPAEQEQPIKQAPKKKAWIPLTDENLGKELMAYGKENPETLVLLKTSKGNMKIRLYKNTPLHRANFIRLIKNNFYKGTVFYRVIDDFMIQGGDSDDWSRQTLKNKMGKYTLPAEINTEDIHQKGALSMAREYEDNPQKRSVPFEFFIVQGIKYTPAELSALEKQYSITISPEHKKIYETVGGCPHLDGQHTVFGQVIEGLSVIDSIAAVPVDNSNWPIDDVTISFQILD